jgi:penicillin-binding protein 2
MDVYGKTGTAEVGSAGNIRNITHFISFVSHNGRRYALAVTIEDGRSGGRSCAPLAAEFFRRYLSENQEK